MGEEKERRTMGTFDNLRDRSFCWGVEGVFRRGGGGRGGGRDGERVEGGGWGD